MVTGPSDAVTVPAHQAQATVADMIDVLAQRGSARWAREAVTGRLEVLGELKTSLLATADRWVEASNDAVGVAPDSVHAAEAWMNGPVLTLRAVNAWDYALTAIAQHGHLQNLTVRQRADGRVLVDTLPVLPVDRILLPGFSAQTWLEAGAQRADVHRRASAYLGEVATPHQPALVLAAGNVASVGIVDAFDQLFGRHRPVLLKLSDVFAHLIEVVEDALAPLVERDVVRVVAAGPTVGEQLVANPAFGAIHVTGTAATRDAIVAQVTARPDGPAWPDGPDGPDGPAGSSRSAGQAQDAPAVSAEIGGLTPIVVVPGPWRKADVAWQATNIASMLVNNGGFNCVTGRVLVQHRAWSGRQPLMDGIRAALAATPVRPMFHPGAQQRFDQATAGRDVTHLGSDRHDGALPYTIIDEVDPDDPWLMDDPFCPVMAEVGLDVRTSIPAFVDHAVEWCNQRVNGGLAAVIIVHPQSLVDAAVAAALDRALETLRYGTIMVNHFAGAAFGTMTTPWGSWQAGQWAHDALLLDRVERTVVWGPFKPVVTPPWIHDRRHRAPLGRRVARLLATGNSRELPALAYHAMRA